MKFYWVFYESNSNIDVSEEEVFQKINETHCFSCLIARKLGITNREIAKGFTYFHKIIRNLSIKTIDYRFYITVCLYIDNKSSNDLLIYIDLFIKQYLVEMGKLKNITIDKLEQAKQVLKEKKFGQIEMQILSLIGFDCEVDLPYYYLDQYSKLIKKEILSEANIRCNDTYYLPLCLFYHPLEIACTAILMSSEKQNSSLPLGWEKYLSNDVDLKQLDHIKSIIHAKIYDRFKGVNISNTS